MKDFRLYDIADFVMDEDFIRWVQLKDPADNLFWESWLQQNPSRHLLVAEARQIVEFIQLEQAPITPADVQVEITRVLNTIEQSKKKDEDALVISPDSSHPGQSRIRLTRTRLTRIRLILIPAAAAAAILLLFIGLPRLTPSKNIPTLSPKIAAALNETSNSSDKPLTLQLPDGSSVRLAPGSHIRYSDKFGTMATRDVYLTGGAYFSVAKNPAHPFRVLTGDLITRVLGTTFCVEGFEKDSVIRITVHTGKVGVYSQSPADLKQAASPDGLIITPNQQLVYHREVKKFQKILIEKPSFIVSDTVDHSMIYEDTPVERVFDQLAKYYGISIVFDNELLSKCTVTADLANEPFYRKLDLICRAIGANYEIVDAQVVIQSNGCQ